MLEEYLWDPQSYLEEHIQGVKILLNGDWQSSLDVSMPTQKWPLIPFRKHVKPVLCHRKHFKLEENKVHLDKTKHEFWTICRIFDAFGPSYSTATFCKYTQFILAIPRTCKKVSLSKFGPIHEQTHARFVFFFFTKISCHSR